MPLEGKGWEMLVLRIEEQRGEGRIRTVGKYQVYHDGSEIADLSGAVAELKGPGDNSNVGLARRIEAGRYPLKLAPGPRYITNDFSQKDQGFSYPQPALLVGSTGNRISIMIHPARGFITSTGCICLSGELPNARSEIDFADSRSRVIAVIEDLRIFLADLFPHKGNATIPNASLLIEEC